MDAEDAEEAEDAEREAEEAEDLRFKRGITVVGFVAVYVSWAIFTWFIFVYGMLVYKLLGQSAVDAFAKSFGTSYALNQVTEWEDIVHEVIKAIVVMLVLERLFISSPVAWMEGALCPIEFFGLLRLTRASRTPSSQNTLITSRLRL